MTHQAYLLLGSNLGDREKQIKAALVSLASLGTVQSVSGLYRTEPWNMEADVWFYNQAVELITELDAHALLARILEIEQSLGRIRSKRPDEAYTSRNIDIDMLYFDAAVIQSPQLVIPHPRIQDRRFALAPMAELNPGFIHPVLQQTQAALLRVCPDESFLELI
ncbi:MAG: 2-amino-4-hydroxy-6-hydroxymethyldihydropteridine diphosphokinase [Cryomorphaceae bacterium]